MTVSHLGMILLFVDNPLKNKEFYSRILNISPVEESETFVLFILKNGMMLGLWSSKSAKTKVTAQPGATEICFLENNVDDIYHHWTSLGITILEEPRHMEGGYSFVASDLDGHRIRILRTQEA
jgi:predicted enzyme related to lactoylglutathione lyase